MRTEDIKHKVTIFLTANILFLYGITVIAVILAIDHFNPSLYSGPSASFPNVLMLTVWFLYYLAPIVIAIIFGLLFRPFWPNFRNLFFAIVTIQLLVSFTFCMLRWDYLIKFQNQIKWKKTDKLKIHAMIPQYSDLNEDGFLDQLAVSPTFDLTRIRLGEYLLHATLVPGDVPLTIDGGGFFTIAAKGTNLSRKFIVAPQMDLEKNVALYVPTVFRIKFILFRVVTIDEKGKALLRWTRWSPYMRSTLWEGGDPQIYGDMILLDTLTTSESYTLPAPVIGIKKH